MEGTRFPCGRERLRCVLKRTWKFRTCDLAEYFIDILNEIESMFHGVSPEYSPYPTAWNFRVKSIFHVVEIVWLWRQHPLGWSTAWHEPQVLGSICYTTTTPQNSQKSPYPSKAHTSTTLTAQQNSRISPLRHKPIPLSLHLYTISPIPRLTCCIRRLHSPLSLRRFSDGKLHYIEVEPYEGYSTDTESSDSSSDQYDDSDNFSILTKSLNWLCRAALYFKHEG